jgi:proteic killer suppression protein
MIKTWANSRSRRFYAEGKISKFRSLDIDAADELLAALDAATSLKDLSPLKSVGLHKLSGDRAGQWAMTVNGPWRICFRFITQILNGKRGISAETALRLARYFGNSAQFWLNLQSRYDLVVVEQNIGAKVITEVEQAEV